MRSSSRSVSAAELASFSIVSGAYGERPRSVARTCVIGEKSDQPRLGARTTRWPFLSIRPAMAKLCPSPSSMLVSMRRVAKAGIVKPLKITPALMSIVDTSGFT